MTKFSVRVLKPVMDWLSDTVEVDAATAEEAEQIAIKKAIEADAWKFSHCGEYDGPSKIEASAERSE